MKNPKLQYNKAGNNYFVYVPKEIVIEQKISRGDPVNLKKWSETIEKEAKND